MSESLLVVNLSFKKPQQKDSLTPRHLMNLTHFHAPEVRTSPWRRALSSLPSRISSGLTPHCNLRVYVHLLPVAVSSRKADALSCAFLYPLHHLNVLQTSFYWIELNWTELNSSLRSQPIRISSTAKVAQPFSFVANSAFFQLLSLNRQLYNSSTREGQLFSFDSTAAYKFGKPQRYHLVEQRPAQLILFPTTNYVLVLNNNSLFSFGISGYWIFSASIEVTLPITEAENFVGKKPTNGWGRVLIV